MKSLRLAAAVLATTLFSFGPAAAANVTGQQLLSLCTANMGGQGNPMEAAECLGFVVGVADTFDCVEDNHGYKWNSAASGPQPHLAMIVVQYIQSHPSALVGGAHEGVAKALSAAYPCPAKAAAN